VLPGDGGSAIGALSGAAGIAVQPGTGSLLIAGGITGRVRPAPR
jgi:hypothetical protein